jgi:hypothetical protein
MAPPPPGVPAHVVEGGTGSLSLAREPDAPQGPSPGLSTAAGVVASHLVGALTGSHAPVGDKPPRQPTMLPAWLSLLLAFAFGTGGAGVGVGAALSLSGGKEVDELKSEFAQFKTDAAADRALLHKNDAALGKWAVDMTRDVSAGLVSLDEISRAIATAQGVDTSGIAKVSIAQPNATVRGLGIQAELEGL